MSSRNISLGKNCGMQLQIKSFMELFDMDLLSAVLCVY